MLDIPEFAINAKLSDSKGVAKRRSNESSTGVIWG